MGAVRLAEVFSTPSDYTQHHSGYQHMVTQHLGRGITEEQRRRWVDILLDTAGEVGLPLTRSSARCSSTTSNGTPGWP